MLITIDGPAGAGKSTVARAVALALDFTYLDSGAMYRCAGLVALRSGADLDDGAALGALAGAMRIEPEDGGSVSLEGEDVTAAIREPEIAAAASRVAAHREVREAMVARQRELIATGRYVAEGRDIGTVVSPDAPLKIYLTASDSERARRRASQSGEPLNEVVVAQRERDERDRGRRHGPLRPASDAVQLDTTGLTVEHVVEQIVRLARDRGLT